MCAEWLTSLMLWQKKDTRRIFSCWVTFETKTSVCLMPNFFPVVNRYSLLEWDDNMPVRIIFAMRPGCVREVDIRSDITILKCFTVKVGD